MLASRRLPAPLMSRAGRAGEPSIEEQGRGRLQFFLPIRRISKVGGRCTHFWWICGFVDAKYLIVEKCCLTKCRFKSIKLPVLSIKSAFCSTGHFSGFALYLSLFFFCKQREEERERHPSKRACNPSNRSAAYFLVHQIDFAFRAFGGLWRMKTINNSMVCEKSTRNPSIHPCFPPTPPGACFYGLH